MASVAILLPCGRDFDEYGLPVALNVLKMQTHHNIRLYIGIKQSNLDRSTHKELLDKVCYLIEPEDVLTSVYPLNLAYRILEEDYFITLADDFEIRGNFLEVIDFIDQALIPVAVLGTCTNDGIESEPYEITYHAGYIGHSGGMNAHPTFLGMPWFAAKTSFLKSMFPEDLCPFSELKRYHSDDLLAFRLQHKFKMLLPFWKSATIHVREIPSTPRNDNYRQEAIRYLKLIRKVEQTNDLCLPE